MISAGTELPSAMALVPIAAQTPSPMLRVVACPKPFSMERVELELPHGATLEELIVKACGSRALMRYARVFIGDMLVPRDRWRVVRPKPGMLITIRVVPQGGGGGKKNPLATVLMIAVIAASLILPGVIAPLLGSGITASTAVLGSLTVGNVITGAIMPKGALLINAATPPLRLK